MHNSKEDLDRFYSNSRRTSSITVPPHGIIPAVYNIETGYDQNVPQETTGVQKTVKLIFVLVILTVLLVGFVFAILSVTRLTKK
ncbi:uncharacterized protein CELE_W02D7.11 [Caenorhabditis elegans]|uniref:Uncharacterized protein n=1 Tax=Caenorhabditis elegans TaxID=6239 RepID=Q8MQH0_CAEEL|nr:Uncharacterized protein CELE_W02D7.11 [Caenorhabditis elegans]CCD69841.1 Uncharacterized protein CELE_W02D7.11 [Caenorhabditis elegans]|eukprot:NP_741575.1 Uncharacterized protein CELE_W02D7.11 [Caenorhabditis elegans]